MISSRPKLPSSVVTQSVIAQHCQVSIMTVSRALRGESCVTPETTARIRAVAAELGYNPAHHIAARRLALRKSGQRMINHLIATLFPREMRRTTYNASLFDGIVDELSQQGYMLVTAVSPNPLESQYFNGIPPLFTCGEIDGIIINPNASISQQFITGLRAQPYFADRPIVSLIYPNDDCSNVLVNGYQGAYDATKHLLELGHRHIMRFDVPGSVTQDARLRGVRMAYQDAGLDAETLLHSVPMPGLWGEPSTLRGENNDLLEVSGTAQRSRYIEGYLMVHPEISAVLASNDSCAIQVWYMLQRLNLSVPDDISLIGFDDTDPILNAQGTNILTTVRMPLEEVGRTAARLVIEQSESRSDEHVIVTLPTELIVRHSTAALRERMPV